MGRFADHESGLRDRVIITGTAGIGKTMFGLYLARTYFQNDEAVVLHYENSFWAFTKKDPKGGNTTSLLTEHLVPPDGCTIWYVPGSTELTEQKEVLTRLPLSGSVITIRDPGETKDLDFVLLHGREV